MPCLRPIRLGLRCRSLAAFIVDCLQTSCWNLRATEPFRIVDGLLATQLIIFGHGSAGIGAAFVISLRTIEEAGGGFSPPPGRLVTGGLTGFGPNRAASDFRVCGWAGISQLDAYSLLKG